MVVIGIKTTTKIMLRLSKFFTKSLIIVLVTVLVSCDREDPGPLQEIHKDFVVTDFDRLEMGSGFRIRVDQANSFSVKVEGDRRNVDDLEVYKQGNTLIIEFKDQGDRHHDTYIDITMPALSAVNFSGGSNSKIRGFESDEVDLFLSGASVCQVDAKFNRMDVVISGGSELLLFGDGVELVGELSGASSLKAFDYPVKEAILELSGASLGKVTVTDALDVTAGGASSVLYRGEPSVVANTSGASSVVKD
jgi:hypothetical protein